MEFLVSEGMSEGTWPFLGQKNSRKISSGPTSGESSSYKSCKGYHQESCQSCASCYSVSRMYAEEQLYKGFSSKYVEVRRVSWWRLQEPEDSGEDTQQMEEGCLGLRDLGRSWRQWLGPASQAEVRSWFWRPQLQSYGCYQEKDEEEAPKRPFPDKKAYMAYK